MTGFYMKRNTKLKWLIYASGVDKFKDANDILML